MAKNKKRILFISSSAPRFKDDMNAPFILNLAQDLSNLGWKVDLLAPHAKNLKKQETIGTVNIIRFQYMFPATLQRLCYRGGALSNLRKSKLNYLLIPFFLFAEFLAAYKLLKKNNYDLIHSHWVVPQGYVGHILSRFKKIPHVISVRGGDMYALKNKAILLFKKQALDNCSMAIATSHSLQSKVVDIANKPRSCVIPTGSLPPTNQPTLQQRLNFCGNDCKLIAFLGRISEEKGLSYLIKSLPIIKKNQKIKLLVLGDGPEIQTEKNHVQNLKLEENVIFVGAVPHKNIYDYLSLSDIFVAPSISMLDGWVEAYGNTVIEAMFAKVPVIGTNIGGIPETVIHEKTGLLVEEKNPREIAGACLRLINDPDLSNRIIKNAYKNVKENYERNQTATKISNIYDEILMNSTPA